MKYTYKNLDSPVSEVSWKNVSENKLNRDVQKDEKKSSDQLSCTDVGTLRAVDVVQRLGRRLVHPPPPLLHRAHTKDYYRIFREHVNRHRNAVSVMTSFLYSPPTEYEYRYGKAQSRQLVCSNTILTQSRLLQSFGRPNSQIYT